MVCDLPWPQLSCPPRLPPKVVHLWSASLLADEEKFLKYQSWMGPREIERANRFVYQSARRRFICARAILKHLLALYTDTVPTEVHFRLGPKGKPYLPPISGSTVQFNSTDTGDEALYAFCLDAEIGVDIEYNTRDVNHSIIAKRKFTAQEYSQYLASPPEERRRFFLSMWTRKEAYGKAIGVGLHYRLNEMNLVQSDRSTRFSVRSAVGDDWEVAQAEPASDLVACVVVEGTGWRYRCQRLSPHGDFNSQHTQRSKRFCD